MSAALVTGAGRGLGLEIARALAARGLTVHVTDVDEGAAAAAAEDIGGSAFFSKVDVRDREACEAATAMTLERAGSLDVWVNNAGILVTGHVWDHDPDTCRLLFEVNTMGTINGTLAALAPMRAARHGHVINIVSLAGLGAPPGEALYGATKHAAIAFSLGTLADLRREGLKDIHVSAVCPDGIWTPMIADKLDVRDREASESAAAMTVERAGPLEVWVNNAGILVTGHVWDHDPDTCRLLFEVNTMGTINGTLAALGPMRQARRGHVINI
ncbi:MAG: SDR family oxidoreductase, partial [Solirubrobacterales bacterium]